MKIIFYDGECGLCQRSVRILLSWDTKKIFHFAPLNGITYQRLFGVKLSTLSTVIFYNEKKVFTKSDAFLEICKELGGLHSLWNFFKLLPRPMRDYFYELIAERRKIFSCVLLQRDERFLD